MDTLKEATYAPLKLIKVVPINIYQVWFDALQSVLILTNMNNLTEIYLLKIIPNHYQLPCLDRNSNAALIVQISKR